MISENENGVAPVLNMLWVSDFLAETEGVDLGKAEAEALAYGVGPDIGGGQAGGGSA